MSLATLAAATAYAQDLVRVDTPGRAFVPEWRDVVADDLPDGRRFRGTAFATAFVKGRLRMPAAQPDEHRMARLVVRFRTSRGGPSLRGVEVRDARGGTWPFETNVGGNYLVREVTGPGPAVNAWVFKSMPIPVTARSVVRLKIQFPGGIDSQIDPGEFVLGAIGVDFVRAAQGGP